MRQFFILSLSKWQFLLGKICLTFIYLSVSMCTMIGQFSRPYFTVPALFKFVV